MKFELNENKVRTIATNVRMAMHDGHVTHSKLLEVLAASLGFRNWDTMSGMLKRESLPKLTLQQPVQMYVEVFATGDNNGPDWAQVVIDQALLDELLSLHALCEDRKLSHVASVGEPTLWQGDHREEPADEAVYFDSTHLYVAGRGMWYRALPKHSYGACETRIVDMGMLSDALARKVSTPYLAWHASSLAGEPPVLVASSTGNTLSFLKELVQDEALSANYLP
jgi:hypothetical protein